MLKPLGVVLFSERVDKGLKASLLAEYRPKSIAICANSGEVMVGIIAILECALLKGLPDLNTLTFYMFELVLIHLK